MADKKKGVDLMPRRRVVGARRILWHIAVFAALGALLLAGGLFGRAALDSRASAYRVAAQVNTLHQMGLDQVKALMAEGLSAEDAKAVNQAVVSKKRSLKTALQTALQEGKTEPEAVQLMWDAVYAALDGKVSQKGLARVAERAGRELDGVKAAVVQAVQAQAGALSLGHIRKELPVTTPHYALIYYHGALLIFGAVLLALALLLSVLYARMSGEQKTRLAALMEPMDYLLPFFAGVAIFTLFPIVRVVIMSFQERYKLDGSFTGWGFGNYSYVLRGVEGTSNYFLQGLGNTFVYVLSTVPVTTALAVVIAYLLNQKTRLRALFQTAYFLPMVTSVTAVGLVWRWIFNHNFGILNAILVLFGAEPVNWLQVSANSMPVLVIFGIWNSLPFTIILLLSGLQNIDETYYTVARVDGAKPLRIFRRITVPLLAPTIGLVLIINSISAFKVFTEVTVLFNGNPGPAYNMYTVVYYIYEMMHQRLELGRAAAAAIVLFLFIFAFTMLQRFIQRKWNYV